MILTQLELAGVGVRVGNDAIRVLLHRYGISLDLDLVSLDCIVVDDSDYSCRQIFHEFDSIAL